MVPIGFAYGVLLPALSALTFMLTPAACTALNSPEPHVKTILDAIQQTQHAIEQHTGNGARSCAQVGCVFLAFWDFDGTILNGDITDGLKRDGSSGGMSRARPHDRNDTFARRKEVTQEDAIRTDRLRKVAERLGAEPRALLASVSIASFGS